MRLAPLGVAGAYVVDLEHTADEHGWCTRAIGPELAEAGIPFIPVQANVARNTAAATLRGIHFQRSPHLEGKLVQCVRGSVCDVVVDVRRESPTFGRAAAVTLEGGSGQALYLPPGCAQGYLTLAPRTDLLYLMDTRYVAGSGVGIRWDDPDLAIEWPCPPRVMSDQDRRLPRLADLDAVLLP